MTPQNPHPTVSPGLLPLLRFLMNCNRSGKGKASQMMQKAFYQVPAVATVVRQALLDLGTDSSMSP